MKRDYPRIVVAPPGPKAKAIVERQNRWSSTSYPKEYPLAIARGERAMVEDVDGNRYLDFMAGIAVASTGYGHPKVVQASQEAAGRFPHICGSDFYFESFAALCERLAQLAPGKSKKRVFLSNSGTEAVEGAIKLARHSTGRPAIVAFTGAFHGRTYGGVRLTAGKAGARAGLGPFLPPGLHRPSGCRYPRAVCRGGAPWTLPIGAIIARESIMKWQPGAHGSTFGGNPVCCAAALATLDVVERELLPNVPRLGERLFTGAKQLQEKYASIGEVRGRGLMIGVEFVKDRATREPAPDIPHDLVERAFRKGLVLLGAGKSALRLSPPLVVDDYAVDTALRFID